MAERKHSQWQISSKRGIARTCEGGQAPLQISPLLYLKPCWDLFGGTVHSFLALWSE